MCPILFVRHASSVPVPHTVEHSRRRKWTMHKNYFSFFFYWRLYRSHMNILVSRLAILNVTRKRLLMFCISSELQRNQHKLDVFLSHQKVEAGKNQSFSGTFKIRKLNCWVYCRLRHIMNCFVQWNIHFDKSTARKKINI